MRKSGNGIPHFPKRLTEFIAQARGISFNEAAKIYRGKEYTKEEYNTFLAKATEVTREEQLQAGMNLMKQKVREDADENGADTYCGMPKISRQLLLNIGKASLRRAEISVMIELARCQDRHADVLMSNRVLSKRIGFSRIMTMSALNSLREYGLITIEKIGGWRYRIHINGNDFENRYRFRQGYIPANTEIFSESIFRKATPPEQFLIMQILFMSGLKQYRDEIREDPSAGEEEVTFYISFEDLRFDFNKSSYYSDYAFTKTFARLKRDFGAEKKSYSEYMRVKEDSDPFCPEGGHMISIRFKKKQLAAVGGSDNFIRKKHILELVAEKQGISLTDEELGEAAKAFPRTDAGIRDIFTKGKEYLDVVKSSSRGRRAYGQESGYDFALEEAQGFLVKVGDMVSRKNGISSITGALRKRRLNDTLLTTDIFLSPEERITCAAVAGELFKSRFFSVRNNIVKPFACAVDNAVQTVFRLFDPQGKLWRDRVPAT